MGDPLGSFSPGRQKQIVRYTLVKSRGKADNIVVEVDGMLQMVSEPLLCRSGYGANLIEDDESQGGGCNTLGISHIGRGQE